MRPGQVRRLRWTDINFGQRQIFIRQSNDKARSQGRHIAMGDLAFAVLCQMDKVSHLPTGMIFGPSDYRACLEAAVGRINKRRAKGTPRPSRRSPATSPLLPLTNTCGVESSGIDGRVLLSVNRVRTTFRDELDNERTGTGTGFWVLHSVEQRQELAKSFVTNRHNLDGNMLWPDQGFQLAKSEIEVRRFADRTAGDEDVGDELGRPLRETTFVEVPTTSWKLHQTADCAGLRTMKLPTSSGSAATSRRWILRLSSDFQGVEARLGGTRHGTSQSHGLHRLPRRHPWNSPTPRSRRRMLGWFLAYPSADRAGVPFSFMNSRGAWAEPERIRVAPPSRFCARSDRFCHM
jgi:hypothetical protein